MKKYLLITVLVLAIAVIGYTVFSRSAKSSISSEAIPATQAQKSFDQSFKGTSKLTPRSIESIQLPDQVTTAFESIKNGNLLFLGSDQVAYRFNLGSKALDQVEIPDSLLGDAPVFMSTDPTGNLSVIGFENSLVYISFTTKTAKIFEVTKPLSAAYQGKFYILSNAGKLSISILSESGLSLYKATDLTMTKAALISFNNQLTILSDSGAYLESGQKFADSNSLVSFASPDELVVLKTGPESILAFYNQSLQKTREIKHKFLVTSFLLDNNQSYLAIRSGNDANDKLLQISPDGKENEVILPDELPSFMREFKIDSILSADSKEIYYADQGNIFKINL